MTKYEFKIWYKHYFEGCNGGKKYWMTYRHKLMSMPFNAEKIQNDIAAREAMNAVKEFFDSEKEDIMFGNCTSAPTPMSQEQYLSGLQWHSPVLQQEEGNNPMLATKAQAVSVQPMNGALAISVSSTGMAKSDEMTQREYLLFELSSMTRYEWQDDTVKRLGEMFNLDVPTAPKTSKELLAAITANRYTVDQKKVDRQAAFYAAEEDDDLWEEDIRNRYFGITFTDLPVADRKGYEAAMVEYRKAVKATQRKIQIGSPADGLAALIALEGFVPSNAPVTVH